MDLDEYAQKQGRAGNHRRCLTCSLDENLLSQIHAARHREKPYSFEIIAKWLETETGKRLHQNTIRNHFVAGHDA